MSFTGASGRLPAMLVQVSPLSVLLYRCTGTSLLPLKPDSEQ